MKKLLLGITALGLILFCDPTVATAENTVLAEKARKSIVELHMSDGGYGSGFLVAPDRVATNLHVIHGATKGTATLVGQTDSFQIEGYTAVNVKQDLIILAVPGLDAPTLNLGDSEAAKIGQTVYAVGNPRGYTGTFSEGNISGIREDDIGKLLQITAPISPGSSGGPVLNNDGDVIGISVAGSVSGQNLNWAIPANDLKLLRERQRSPIPYLAAAYSGRIECSGLKWLDNSKYPSYSVFVKNLSRSTAKNIYCIAIFVDEDLEVFGIDVIKIPEIGAGKKKTIIRKSIFTYESGEESKEFRDWILRMSDDQRAGELSRHLIQDSRKILEGVKRMLSVDDQRAGELSRQFFEEFKELDDYNFLAPDVKQKHWQTKLLTYDMEPDFIPIDIRP